MMTYMYINALFKFVDNDDKGKKDKDLLVNGTSSAEKNEHKRWTNRHCRRSEKEKQMQSTIIF